MTLKINLRKMKTINQLLDLLTNHKLNIGLTELHDKLLKAKMDFGGRTMVENSEKIVERIKMLTNEK
jgi:hypothetical protein